MICLDSEVLDKLSSKGVLAYVAVSLAGNVDATTAALAGLVKAQAAAMREGLNELALGHPELVRKAKGMKWHCGESGAGNVVQILDSDLARRREFLDDLKAIWEWANKTQFTMNGFDGLAINGFLRQHKDWDRQLCQRALRNRFLSEAVSKAQAPYQWLSKLPEYLEAPLDRYGKVMLNGGGKHGQTATVRQRNREAIERAVAHA